MKTVVLFGCLAFGQMAAACMVHRGFQLSDIQHADLVFEGQVVRYGYFQGGASPNNFEYALVTLNVTNRIFGKVEDSVTIFWPMGGSRGQDIWSGPDRVILALRSPQRQRERLFHGIAVTSASPRPNLLVPVHEFCSGPYILPPDQKLREVLTTLMQRPTAEIGAASHELLVNDPELLTRAWYPYRWAMGIFSPHYSHYVTRRLVFASCIGDAASGCAAPPARQVNRLGQFITKRTRLAWPPSIKPMRDVWTMP